MLPGPREGDAMRLCNPLLAVVTATAVFGTVVATASARQLEFSSQTLRATFREVRLSGLPGEVTCQVTLEGSLHSRTIAKALSTLIGYITRARLGPCAVGTATILQEWLPWHLRYGGFTGTLPNITRVAVDVALVGIRVRTNVGEICLILSFTPEPLTLTMNVAAGGVLSSMSWSNEIKTGPECFEFKLRPLSDNGPVTVLNSTTRVTIRLI
jgi:hypothetical protein